MGKKAKRKQGKTHTGIDFADTYHSSYIGWSLEITIFNESI